MIQGLYSPGGLGNFLQKHPSSIRIDDCMDRDLTELGTTNPAAAVFFAEYAGAYGMKAVLISYRDGTYGIWEDGLKIRSYAAFDEEVVEAECFELQAFDGLLFSCTDRVEGADLQIVVSQEGWIDLGETEGDLTFAVFR